MPQRSISADKIAAVRGDVQLGLTPPEICRRNGISLATCHRIKAAIIREDAATKRGRTIVPSLTAAQIKQLCRFFPALSVPQQTRLAEDVRQAARATLCSTAPPRPGSIVVELERAIAQVRAKPRKSISLSASAWIRAGGDPEAEDYVLPRRKGRLQILLAGLQLARDEVDQTGDRHGGRLGDARLRIFVSDLGTIYETAADAALTYSLDPASNALNSPFSLFVLEALGFLYSAELDIPLGAVRMLIKRLAQFKPELIDIEPDEF